MPRILSALLLLVPGALALALTRPAAQPATPPVLRVGAWNIEWLGYPDRRKGPDQSIEHLAKYLLENKVDVLAVEEVSYNEGSDAEPRNKSLSAALAWIKEKTGQEWKHRLFSKLPGEEPEFEKHQWTGVVWNTARVQLVGEPFRIPVRRNEANKDIWARWPHAVKFTTGAGKTDLVLIPVHMKSNRGGVAVTTAQRVQEATTLIRALGEVANKFSDDDIIVLGDFNMRSNAEKGHARFASAGLRDLNADDTATWIADASFSAAPFDRIFVPDNQPEFTNAPFQVANGVDFLKNTRYPGTGEEKFRHYLSDHWMVVTEVTITDDDD